MRKGTRLRFFSREQKDWLQQNSYQYNTMQMGEILNLQPDSIRAYLIRNDMPYIKRKGDGKKLVLKPTQTEMFHRPPPQYSNPNWGRIYGV